MKEKLPSTYFRRFSLGRRLIINVVLPRGESRILNANWLSAEDSPFGSSRDAKYRADPSNVNEGTLRLESAGFVREAIWQVTTEFYCGVLAATADVIHRQTNIPPIICSLIGASSGIEGRLPSRPPSEKAPS